MESSSLEIDLNFVDGFAAGGHSNAETVEEECRVAILVSGPADIGIVVVVVGEIPVTPVKTNSMGQDLESRAGALVWMAYRRRNIVFAGNGLVLPMIRIHLYDCVENPLTPVRASLL